MSRPLRPGASSRYPHRNAELIHKDFFVYECLRTPRRCGCAGVTCSLAGCLGVSGCRGDLGDCGTFGQAVRNSPRYRRDAL